MAATKMNKLNKIIIFIIAKIINFY